MRLPTAAKRFSAVRRMSIDLWPRSRFEEATIELPGEEFQVRARQTEGEERRRLYDAQAALMPAFADYEQKTSREIPLFVLERVS